MYPMAFNRGFPRFPLEKSAIQVILVANTGLGFVGQIHQKPPLPAPNN